MPDAIQIAIFAHVAKIAIAELDGAAQDFQGLLRFFEQGVAARKIVVCQGIVGAEADEALIDLQTLGETALEREIVALDAENIDKIGVPLEKAAEEFQLEIQLALFVRTNQRGAACGSVRFFLGVLPLVRHFFSLRDKARLAARNTGRLTANRQP